MPGCGTRRPRATTPTVLGRLPRDFQHLAEWWDQFATGRCRAVRWVSGRESLAAARRVADALSAWHRAGAAGGDLNFWRPYVAEFDSPQAYEWVIEALLEKRDLAAAMALLMHWLGRAEEVRLDEGPHSFHSLAERWLRMALDELPPSRPPLALPPPPRAACSRKFFDFLEANADTYWEVPELESRCPSRNRGPSEARRTAETPESRRSADDDDDPRSLYSAAYDEMVYRDSTADDIEGSMMESVNPRTESEAEDDSSRLARSAWISDDAGPALEASGDSRKSACAEPIAREIADPRVPLVDCLAAWRERAEQNGVRLRALADAVARQAIPKPTANPESLVEYDRRWNAKESLVERIVASERRGR